jgi:hypothetical protein
MKQRPYPAGLSFRLDSTGEAKTISVRRFDAPEQMAKPELQPNGWLRCEGVLTKSGIFKYRNPDGTERRELRLPDEVFNPDSMKSFHLVPVTDDHPEVGWLDASTASQFSKGAADMPVRDGDKMRAKLLITDAVLVAKIMNREKAQISNGYFADLEMRSGEFEGETFDAIQRNIRGNHVAIVDEARAGPDARIKLDSLDAVMVPFLQVARPAPTEVKTVDEMTLKIDGVDFKMPAQAAQAVTRQLAIKDSKIEELTAENGKLAGKYDALASDAKKAGEALKAARDPKAIAALVNARVDLVEKARTVLGDEFKPDAMTDREIKAAVVSKLSPGAKLDGKSDDYVNARFDAAMESSETSGLDAVRQVINAPEVEAPNAPKLDALETFKKASQDAWKSHLTAHKTDKGKIRQ